MKTMSQSLKAKIKKSRRRVLIKIRKQTKLPDSGRKCKKLSTISISYQVCRKIKAN